MLLMGTDTELKPRARARPGRSQTCSGFWLTELDTVPRGVHPHRTYVTAAWEVGRKPRAESEDAVMFVNQLLYFVSLFLSLPLVKMWKTVVTISGESFVPDKRR